MSFFHATHLSISGFVISIDVHLFYDESSEEHCAGINQALLVCFGALLSPVRMETIQASLNRPVGTWNKDGIISSIVSMHMVAMHSLHITYGVLLLLYTYTCSHFCTSSPSEANTLRIPVVSPSQDMRGWNDISLYLYDPQTIRVSTVTSGDACPTCPLTGIKALQSFR